MSALGRSVVVLGAGSRIGADVASGITLSGHHTVTVNDDGIDSGAAYADAIRAAAPHEVTAIVDAGFIAAPPPVGALAALDPGAWATAAEEPMRRALHVLQGAHLCLREIGGRIVVVLPSLVMSGAANTAAWTAAAEGYRALTKAAARAWGTEGISIKCVLVPAGLAVPAAGDRPGLQPPALGHEPGVGSEVAPAIAALLDERLDSVTGLTLAVDGGVWMTS